MNQTKTTKFRNIFLAVVAIIIITATGASAQQKLGDLVESILIGFHALMDVFPLNEDDSIGIACSVLFVYPTLNASS